MIYNITKSADLPVISKGWGFERVVHNSKDYCGKELVLYKNRTCSIHYHKKKRETFYILSGSLILELYSEPFEVINSNFQETLDSLLAFEQVQCKVVRMDPGDSIFIDILTPHRFIGLADETHFIEFSTQHFEDDSYRIFPGDSQNV